MAMWAADGDMLARRVCACEGRGALRSRTNIYTRRRAPPVIISSITRQQAHARLRARHTPVWHARPRTVVTGYELVRVIHAYACATRTRCGGGHAHAGPPRTWWQVWAVHPVSAGSTASRKYSGRGVGSLSQSRVRTSQGGGSSICKAALKSAVGDFSG